MKLDQYLKDAWVLPAKNSKHDVIVRPFEDGIIMLANDAGRRVLDAAPNFSPDTDSPWDPSPVNGWHIMLVGTPSVAEGAAADEGLLEIIALIDYCTANGCSVSFLYSGGAKEFPRRVLDQTESVQ